MADPVIAPYLPENDPMVGTGNIITRAWLGFMQRLQTSLTSVQQIVNANLGVLVNTLLNQPTGLGVSDAGLLFHVSDYQHTVRWTGAVWEWFGGDRPGRIEGYAVNPGVGYQVCDGTVTDYLVVGGAALTTAPFPTPNPPDGTFLKQLAAYTGVINAAIAPGISGETADVGDSGAVAGDMDILSANVDNDGLGSTINVVRGTASTFIHRHGVGSLAVNSAGRPPSLGVPLYFRR